MAQHCWHSLGELPELIFPEVCCWCGGRRTRVCDGKRPDGIHGPFALRVATNCSLMYQPGTNADNCPAIRTSGG